MVFLLLRALLAQPSDRRLIRQPADVLAWMHTNQQHRIRPWAMTMTCTIDPTGQRWIADRQSEHVVCAVGQPVIAAGEITFTIQPHGVVVTEITNQSRGYCPEPDTSATTLDTIGVDHPPAFTTCFIFRRCHECKEINVVKEGMFECAVYEAPLSQT